MSTNSKQAMLPYNLPINLSGIVKKYTGNGRKLGYPTANIDAATDLTDGVYFGFASLAQHEHHPALIFIGVPVTVGDTERRVEVHLLDIDDKDYYNLPLKVEVKHFHRPNQKLSSVDELLVLMANDEKVARAWFAGQSKLAS